LTDRPDEIQVPAVTDGGGIEPPGPDGPAPEIEGYRIVGLLGRGMAR